MFKRNAGAGYRGPDRRASLPLATDGGYRGPDRRTRRRPQIGASRLRITAALAVIVLSVLVALGATAAMRALTTFDILRSAANVLVLLAGVGQLLVWRLTGRAGPALTGAGFAVSGGLMLPLHSTGLLLHRVPDMQQMAPGCTVVLGITGAYLCMRSTWARSVVANLRPIRDASLMTFAAVGALVIMGIIRGVSGNPLDGVWPWSLALALVALAWLAAAAGYGRLGQAGGRRDVGMAVAVGGLAFGDGILAWGIAHHPTIASIGMAVQTLAAGGLVVISVTALERCLGQQGNRTLRLAGELGDTVRVLAEEQSARQQMLHDARSTLAAIRLANGTLSRYQEQLDEMLQAELREAVGSELVRLEQLLSRDHGRERVDFDLAETLAPVVLASRDGGLDVTADLTGAPLAQGRPADTCTVIHSLLANAARYAGGPVTLTFRSTSAAVQILVSDRGPGIAAEERQAVFGRGVRGAAAQGSEGAGLGLFIGRWLMDEQEGSLQVEDHAGGGVTFVVTLPRSPVNPTHASPSMSSAGHSV